VSRRPPCTLRAVRVGAAVLVVAGVLAGCANRDPVPAPGTSPAATPTPGPSAATQSSGADTPSAPPPAGMPVPTSTGNSPVDADRIRSLADLPAAFQCPSAVTPITIPATTTPVTTPTGTATTAPTTPTGTATTAAGKGTSAAVVCASRLARDEALYLWFCATPEDKLAALTAALATTKYVHAGPNWVAGATINADMGTVGGEVYR